jgi:hypothetical protein
MPPLTTPFGLSANISRDFQTSAENALFTLPAHLGMI